LRNILFILLFVSFISRGQKEDLKQNLSDSNLIVDLFDVNKKSENLNSKDSVSTWIKFGPDLVFSITEHKPFNQSGLSINLGFNKIEKKGFKWGGNFNFRSGLTSQGSIPYFSDPQSRALSIQKLKEPIFKEPSNIYFDINAILYYNYRNISLFAGIDKLNDGFSSRSIFGSSYGISNPFARMEIKFNEVFSFNLRQDVLREKIGNHFEPKGKVTHSFLYNHKGKSKFQVRLFESVIYQIKDTLYNRGFEVEYLNPFLFFRPQEYNIGSADNILLGTEFQYTFKERLTKKGKYSTKVYTQLLIDDFLLSAFRARNGWWANKYGFNLGLFTSFDKKDTLGKFTSKKSYTLDFTLMRPYIFSQTNPGIVYGNQGLPISHPLGSNFVELFQRFEWTPKNHNVRFDAFLQVYIKGTDSVGLKTTSYGGDIYKSYSKHPYEYNNRIGQGITLRGIQIGTRFSYINLGLKSIQNLIFYIEPRYRFLFFENIRQTDLFVTIGIQSSLWNHIDRLNY
jgi:hypothetical protein